VLPRSGDSKREICLQTPVNGDNAVLSPDGRRIAHDSDESGRPEVYIRPFPAAGGRYPVSRSGGTQPWWRDDGQELFFLTLDGTLISASVSRGEDLEAGVLKALFATGNIFNGADSMRGQYSVARNGKQLLTIVAEQRTNSCLITVVVNGLAAREK
jgi:eukaryotic-like serine/threonine-protein kinase